MLTPVTIPGLFITGTDTGVGKTVIAAAIADHFRRRGANVAVCKLAATGCVRRREGLVSEDAEFLAHCADSRFPLDLVCPQCYAEPLAPAIAAERAKQPLDWQTIQRSLTLMSRQSDVIVIEGVGGVMVPMDSQSTIVSVAAWLKIPSIIVARPGLGTINHTLLTLTALRAAKVEVPGVVINRYPVDSTGVAEETSPRAIEKWGKTNVLCLVPDVPVNPPGLPPDIAAAIDTVDWAGLAKTNAK